MTAPAAMSAKEVEASLSLLHMMLPVTVSATTAAAAAATPSPAESVPLKQEGVHDSLLRVVASQADALALIGGSGSGSDGGAEDGSWTPRGFLKRNTQLTTLSRELSLDELRAHFGKPIVEVAKEFGICTTFLKKICRRCGIKRWPHRQIRSLSRTIQMLHQAEVNATTAQERTKFMNQIAQLEAKKRAVIQDPDANGKLKRVKKCGSKSKSSGSSSGGSTTSGAATKSEDDIDMDASDEDDIEDQDDAMRLLEMAGAHQPAGIVEAAPKIAGSESALTHDGNGSGNGDPVDKHDLAPIIIAGAVGGSPPPSSPSPAAAAVKTPVASSKAKCSSSDESGGSEPSGLKISPSNRKILGGAKKYDSDKRLRSSSMGSLQDEDEQSRRDLAVVAE